MINIEVEIDGKAKLVKAIENFQGDIEDLRPIWRDVQSEFYKIEQKLFDTQGGSGASGKWADLSEPYKQFKQKKYGFVYPILRRTNALMTTLVSEITGSVVEKRRDSMDIGTRLPRARQLYDNKKKPRKAIDMTESNKRRLVAVIGNSLATLAKKEGFDIN